MSKAKTFTTIKFGTYGGPKYGKTHNFTTRTECDDPSDEKVVALCGFKTNHLLVNFTYRPINCKKCLSKMNNDIELRPVKNLTIPDDIDPEYEAMRADLIPVESN